MGLFISINSMKFQLLSDLHLRNGAYVVRPAAGATILLLAGDVDNACERRFRDFLVAVAAVPQYRHIVLIRGNHEAFGSSLEETDRIIHDLAAVVPKLVFLNRSCFDVPGTDVRIAGCTLWSRVSDAQQRRVAAEIGDFQSHGIREWSLDRRHDEHARDVDFIAGATAGAEADGRRVLLLTHHAPILNVANGPSHEHGPYTSSYQCDLAHRLVPPVAVAAFGHTHFSMDTRLPNGVRLVSNQRGRKDDVDNVAFRDDFTFET